MRPPFMPRLTDPRSPFSPALFCSALDAEPRAESELLGTLTFLKEEFARDGAKHVWLRSLYGHHESGRTALLTCVEHRETRMCG